MTETNPNPLRVLVVDDEKSIADSLALILRTEGHDVRCANSAEEALDVLPVFEPHVLIADVILGGVDGVQLALMAAEILPNCTVVLSSGHAEPSELAERLRQCGRRFDVYAKPVPPPVLIDFMKGEAERRSLAIAAPNKARSGHSARISPQAGKEA
jgi:DNA-binding NtrC family response regulator